MKINRPTVFCLTTLFLTTSVSAKDAFTVGLGTGSLYAGLGFNVGLQSNTDFKYLSAGCTSYSTYTGKTCGFGIGYMTTELLKSQSKHHAANFYVGIIGTERNYARRYFEDKAIYGAGLGYSYFFSGIDKSGGNIGFTLLGGKRHDDLSLGGMFQLGYQF